MLICKIMKQYILINDSLNMSVGKIGAACAHASLGVFFDILKKDEEVYLEPRNELFPTDFTGCIRYSFSVEKSLVDWIEGPFTKICLSARDIDMMLKAVELAKDVRVLYKVIKDAGNTEVPPGSTTAVAIGPFDPSKSINKKLAGYLTSLPLLK